METEIIRLRYGASYIEFFDHSFGEDLDQNDYSLFSIELNDARLWLQYRNKILKVGKELPILYKQVDDNNESVMMLRRGLLDQISDYVLKVKFAGEKIKSITAVFD